MAKLVHTRWLIAGALTFLTLAPFGAAFAQPDDGDDKEIEEEAIPAERGFRMLGGGREHAAWEALEGHDRSVLVKQAMETVRTSDDADAVVGAAVFLGDPKVRGSVSGDQAKQVRSRLSEAGADSKMRGALIEALGAVGTAQDLWQLKKMVRGGNPDDVEQAARALCRSSDGDALGSLLFSAEAMDDPERLEAVKEALAWMAESERGGELVEAMGPSAPVAMLQVLTRVRSAEGAAKVRQVARERLGSDNAEVRAVALELLVSSRDTKATELVVGALADEDPSVRAAAAAAARQLTVEEAVPKLIELLSDERVAQDAAHEALVSLTGVQLPKDRRSWQMWLDKQRKKDAQSRAKIADEEQTAGERDRQAQEENAASGERVDPRVVAGGAAVVLILLVVAAVRVMREKPRPVKLVEVGTADSDSSQSRRKQRKGTTAWTRRFHAKELKESIAEASAGSEIDELIAPTEDRPGEKRASAWTERLKRMVEGGEFKMHAESDEASSLPPSRSTSSRMLGSLLSDEWGREEE